MKTFIFNVAPCAAPRMTRADSWKKRPVVLRYRAFKDALRAEAARLAFVQPCANFAVRFYVEPAPSFSDKKRAGLIGKPHQIKPDLDNFMKAYLDALLPDGDQGVYQYSNAKYYGIPARIEVDLF